MSGREAPRMAKAPRKANAAGVSEPQQRWRHLKVARAVREDLRRVVERVDHVGIRLAKGDAAQQTTAAGRPDARWRARQCVGRCRDMLRAVRLHVLPRRLRAGRRACWGVGEGRCAA